MVKFHVLITSSWKYAEQYKPCPVKETALRPFLHGTKQSFAENCKPVLVLETEALCENSIPSYWGHEMKMSDKQFPNWLSRSTDYKEPAANIVIDTNVVKL